MKNILFVSYQFPPLAGPGVHRSLNFAKHLRTYNYNPIILKADESKFTFEKVQTDFTLLNNLPPDLTIIKTKPYNLDKTKKLLIKLKLFRLSWFFMYPLFWNKGAIWPFKVFKIAKEAINKYNIKIVYTTSGPFSSWILGYLLKKRLKIKWVADIRDPFVDGYMWFFPSKIHWHLAKIFEKWILSKADHIIVNTPEVKKLYSTRNYANKNQITIITNGF